MIKPFYQKTKQAKYLVFNDSYINKDLKKSIFLRFELNLDHVSLIQTIYFKKS